MDSLPNIYNPDNDDSFDVSEYLDAANRAQDDGYNKLAIHLYMAAYEADGIANLIPSQEALEGMRKAWSIACRISDKPSAEAIFTVLAPYSSPEDVDEKVHQLQKMAVDQLEEMGVPSDKIEHMSPIHSPEATAAGADPDFLKKFNGMMSGEHKEPEEPEPEPPAKHSPTIPQWGKGNESNSLTPKTYSDLVGYESEMKSMCVYGFDAAVDDEYKQFLQETSEFHGLEGLSLYDPFLFYGPSRDDVFEFAEATAGEIGNPVLTLHVRTDDDGLWTIRLSGPFRRGLFGVSDPTDIPTPCTFIIENIDILQDFIKESIANEMDYPEEFSRGNRTYSEILGYIHAILQKPDVFPILTSQEDVRLSPQFEEMFEQVQRIKVDYPTLDERKRVWNNFAIGHTSFSAIDIDELSNLSEGISRHDMVIAGRNAVRDAYQESLNNSEYRFVDIRDVLFEMVPFVSQGEPSYSAIEDAAVEAFVDDLSDITFEDEDSEDQDGQQ
ncbi:MAG: hypothetical protein ACOYIK_03830 [Coriobacteriales bacterium]|jgi:hypothetical protein